MKIYIQKDDLCLYVLASKLILKCFVFILSIPTISKIYTSFEAKFPINYDQAYKIKPIKISLNLS